MFLSKRSVVVDAPTDKVFGYLVDVTKWHQWESKSAKYKRTSEEPLRLGSTFIEIRGKRSYSPSPIPGRPGEAVYQWSGPMRRTWQVTEFVPNERLVFESGGLGIRGRGFIEVRPSEGGTQIVVGSELVRIAPWILPIWPLFYLALLLTWPLRRWSESRMMRRLKKRAEAIP